ncbi:hypothetical protein [Paraburkholderia humisilvae]|uniref:Uncharacterized protein n=1 Tax=Paraburkholderia humisilvae TaxID=627669 RepID=A0A6J5DMP1_9BURK|nr:hypothetical protein [Paraburkholderia humisilvae]CAB3754784.1 hypothetical protein LMG29542_02453 [Paraburkholderia humisilvae]
MTQKIVGWSSATRLCDNGGVPIEGADHVSIVKPDGPDSATMTLFFNAMKEYVIDPISTPIVDIPELSRDGDHFLLNIDRPDGLKKIHLQNHGKSVARAGWGPPSPPNLWLMPDTESIIPPGKEGVVNIAVVYGSQIRDYDFPLRVQGLTEKRVHVHVQNMRTVHASQKALMDKVTLDLVNYVSDPARSQQLSSFVDSDALASQQVVDVVQQSVAQRLPELTTSEQYVIAADLLAAKNLRALAARSLSTAQLASPRSPLQRAETTEADESSRYRSAAWGGAWAYENWLTQRASAHQVEALYRVAKSSKTSITLLYGVTSPIENSSEVASSTNLLDFSLASTLKEIPALKATGTNLSTSLATSYRNAVYYGQDPFDADYRASGLQTPEKEWH